MMDDLDLNYPDPIFNLNRHNMLTYWSELATSMRSHVKYVQSGGAPPYRKTVYVLDIGDGPLLPFYEGPHFHKWEIHALKDQLKARKLERDEFAPYTKLKPRDSNHSWAIDLVRKYCKCLEGAIAELEEELQDRGFTAKPKSPQSIADREIKKFETLAKVKQQFEALKTTLPNEYHSQIDRSLRRVLEQIDDLE